MGGRTLKCLGSVNFFFPATIGGKYLLDDDVNGLEAEPNLGLSDSYVRTCGVCLLIMVTQLEVIEMIRLSLLFDSATTGVG